MALRIPTKHLVGLLTDLAHTAASPEVGEATAAILLHTTRGYAKGDPGKTDLLVATSTDGVFVGHAHIECYGQIRPMLWPISEVNAVVAVLKPLAKITEHAVEISREGDTISVAEDADLFGGGLKLTFASLDPADFPTDGVHGLLTEIRTTPADNTAPAPAPRTDFSPSRLAPFLKIAARRGEILQLFRYHQRLPVTVQIGSAYRGIVRPLDYRDDDPAAGAFPHGDVYPILLEQEPVDA